MNSFQPKGLEDTDWCGCVSPPISSSVPGGIAKGRRAKPQNSSKFRLQKAFMSITKHAAVLISQRMTVLADTSLKITIPKSEAARLAKFRRKPNAMIERVFNLLPVFPVVDSSNIDSAWPSEPLRRFSYCFTSESCFRFICFLESCNSLFLRNCFSSSRDACVATTAKRGWVKAKQASSVKWASCSCGTLRDSAKALWNNKADPWSGTTSCASPVCWWTSGSQQEPSTLMAAPWDWPDWLEVGNESGNEATSCTVLLSSTKSMTAPRPVLPINGKQRWAKTRCAAACAMKISLTLSTLHLWHE